MLRLKLTRLVAGFLGATALALLPNGASAQSGEPIKIGFGMSLTGPLAANGKQALLGMKIWEEETNAAGGLLGRPIKLIYYDDQSNPSTVPGIYTKLLDVDKVELVVGGYATNMNAPAMPVVMQKNKTYISLFSLDVNAEFKYPKYFSVLPTGPDTKASFTEGLFEMALKQNPKPTTVALAAEDAEFSRNACETAPTRLFRSAFTASLVSPTYSFSMSVVLNAPATAAPMAKPTTPSTSGCFSSISDNDDFAFETASPPGTWSRTLAKPSRAISRPSSN